MTLQNAVHETSYSKLVESLKKDDILKTWPDVTPLSQISGVPTSAGSSKNSEAGVFEGHDEEQIKLMDELCIVLDYDDTPVGAGTKKLCHLMDNINGGLLHRAFSVFFFNQNDELLLQQRADEKITFPSMWTNTCCSHPLCVPSELGVTSGDEDTQSSALERAIAGAKTAAQRKLFHELGIPATSCPVSDFQFLTRIHYKSESGKDSKWGEHEIDYILVIRAREKIPLDPNANEVKDYRYVSATTLREMMDDKNLTFTPWFKLICETFLFKWWDKLSDLSSYQDSQIHRLL